MPIPARKSPRLQRYDYSQQNYYFITICTYQHKNIFGTPEHLNIFGKIALHDLNCISEHYPEIRIDKSVVMPNHVHAIIVIESERFPYSISQLIALYKTGVTKQIRAIQPGMQVWQRSFYDHIIRNQKSYEEIWTYIDNNPKKWEQDELNQPGENFKF